MSIRTPLGRARGHGSAKDGVHHWTMMRATSIALVPLALWLAISMMGMIGAEYEEVVAWVGSPVVAVLLAATIIITFYHMAMGLQMVWEDYVPNHALRTAGDLVTKGLALLFALGGLLAVLRMALAA